MSASDGINIESIAESFEEIRSSVRAMSEKRQDSEKMTSLVEALLDSCADDPVAFQKMRESLLPLMNSTADSDKQKIVVYRDSTRERAKVVLDEYRVFLKNSGDDVDHLQSIKAFLSADAETALDIAFLRLATQENAVATVPEIFELLGPNSRVTQRLEEYDEGEKILKKYMLIFLIEALTTLILALFIGNDTDRNEQAFLSGALLAAFPVASIVTFLMARDAHKNRYHHGREELKKNYGTAKVAPEAEAFAFLMLKIQKGINGVKSLGGEFGHQSLLKELEVLSSEAREFLQRDGVTNDISDQAIHKYDRLDLLKDHAGRLLTSYALVLKAKPAIRDEEFEEEADKAPTEDIKARVAKEDDEGEDEEKPPLISQTAKL